MGTLFFFFFFYGEVRSKEVADQTRPEEQVSGGRGGLGCLRLYGPDSDFLLPREWVKKITFSPYSILSPSQQPPERIWKYMWKE